MSRMTFALVLGIGLGGCDLEIRGAGQVEAQERVPSAGAYAMAPAVREVCRSSSNALGLRRRQALPGEVDRILPAGGFLLMVGPRGLARWEGDVWTHLHPGRDFALRGDTLARLDGESLTFLPLRPANTAGRVRGLSARSHDSSFDVGWDRVYLHSAVDENGILLAARSIHDGRVVEPLLRVERDFLSLFLNDFDRLLEETSVVRAGHGWVALTPILRNPISLFDTRRRRRIDVYTPGREQGRVRAARESIVDEEPECPTCTRRVRERLVTRYDRIHADAVIDGGFLWILGTERPGGRQATIFRLRLDSPEELEVFPLPELDSVPRALAILEYSVLVASQRELYWFERPSSGTCAG